MKPSPGANNTSNGFTLDSNGRICTQRLVTSFMKRPTRLSTQERSQAVAQMKKKREALQNVRQA